jgi:paraquat-inducible protein A
MESEALKACHCCGLVQRVPWLGPESRAVCGRSGTVVSRAGGRLASNRRTAALALSALVLYPLAISLPVMSVERFGHRTEASILAGSVELFADGAIFVGAVVLLCSVVLPFLKLVGLLAIAAGVLRRRHRALTYRLIEWTGRWGMLDVLLVAVVVAAMKLGDLLAVRAGPGALAFTVTVLLSLFASASFDPHALWEERASDG